MCVEAVAERAPGSHSTSHVLTTGTSWMEYSSPYETVLRKKLLVFFRSKSSREAPISLKSPRTTLNDSKSLKGTSISEEAQRPVLVSEIQEETNRSSGASSTVLTSEVQSTLSRVCEAEEEINSSSQAPSMVSTFEEITTRAEVSMGLQRKSSQIGKEKANDFPQNLLQQSDTTVRKNEGFIQAGGDEGKKTIVPMGNARESDYSQTLTEGFQNELARKDLIIADLDKKAKSMEDRAAMWRCRHEALCNDYEDVFRNFRVVDSNRQDLEKKHHDLKRSYMEKETELLDRLEASAKSAESMEARAADLDEKAKSMETLAAGLDKKARSMEARAIIWGGKHECLDLQYDELYRNFQELDNIRRDLERRYHDLKRSYKENETELLGRLEASEKSHAWNMSEKDKLVRELRGQLEQIEKNGILQN